MRSYNLRVKKITSYPLRLAHRKEVANISRLASIQLDTERYKNEIQGFAVLDLAYLVILEKPLMEENEMIYMAKDRYLKLDGDGLIIKIVLNTSYPYTLFSCPKYNYNSSNVDKALR